MIEPFRREEQTSICPIRTIVHPTDCSGFSSDAFAHALCIAIATKADLHPLHIANDDAAEAPKFPQPERILAQWGLIEEGDNPVTVAAKLGVRITNVTMDAKSPEEGIHQFLNQTSADLVVLATHGRDGLEHWLAGSIAESAFRQSAVPTLFITTGARGFVQQVTGKITLRRVPYRSIIPPRLPELSTARVSLAACSWGTMSRSTFCM
jgi:nucleotide-binding universal stress UspA family protein